MEKADREIIIKYLEDEIRKAQGLSHDSAGIATHDYYTGKSMGLTNALDFVINLDLQKK